jgi:hypothetical protein
MEAEQKINALRFCLQCDHWNALAINSDGWWRPIDCEFWNGQKGTPEKPYGPTNGCKYKLEHYLLDNRLGFKLVSGEAYLPVIEFAEKYLNLKWCDEKTERDFKVKLTKYKGMSTLYLTRTKTNSSEIIIEDIVSWINSNLKMNGYRKLTRNYSYDKFKKDKKSRGGKWVFERTEESDVKR